MKLIKIVLILVALGGSSLASAQFNSKVKMENSSETDYKQFSWGFSVGANYLDTKITPNENALDPNYKHLITVDTKPGFQVGLIGKYRINDYIDVRTEPTLYFGEKTITFKNIEDENNPEYAKRELKSTYLDIPLLVNVHGDRWGNTRPYVQAGVGYTRNLSSNEKKEQDNSDDIFRMKTNNFNYQLEAGVEIYFEHFKLTPAIKGIFFLNNEIVADNAGTPPIWAGSIKSMQSRAIVFSLKFE